MEQSSRYQKNILAGIPFRRLIKTAGFLAIGLAAVVAILGLTLSLRSGMPLFSAYAPVEEITSSLDHFKYQPDRIQTGTVYHYIKSNIDGSKDANVTLYVASLKRIEVFKVYPKASVTNLVIANMDWNRFSPGSLESYDLHVDGARSLAANARLEAGDRYQYYIANLLWAKNTTSSALIGHYPTHNYNFDLASLNFAFPHLIDPTQDFEIGVQMPCFDLAHLGKVKYLGKASIHYLGEEDCHATRCRKYVVGGSAFGQQEGYLWVNKEGGYFEKVEIPVRNNPGWRDFKLELIGMENMDEYEWKDYIVTQTKKFLDGSRHRTNSNSPYGSPGSSESDPRKAIKPF